MQELSGLKNIEISVDSVNSFLTEHHEGTSMASHDISEGVKAVKTLCQENKAICSKVQAVVASDSTVLGGLNQVENCRIKSKSRGFSSSFSISRLVITRGSIKPQQRDLTSTRLLSKHFLTLLVKLLQNVRSVDQLPI